MMMMRWIRNSSLACFATIAGVGVSGTTFGQQYYGRPVHGNGCAPRHTQSLGYGNYGYRGYNPGFGYGYPAYRPIVVPNYGYGIGNGYSSFYRGNTGFGNVGPTWGGYGMGGFPSGGSYGGGAFPRGGSFGGGPGFSLYLGR